jgi:hypothetical protein
LGLLASNTKPPATGAAGALLGSGALTVLPPQVKVVGGAGGAIDAFGASLASVAEVADFSAGVDALVDAGMLHGITFGSSGTAAGTTGSAGFGVGGSSAFPFDSIDFPPAVSYSFVIFLRCSSYLSRNRTSPASPLARSTNGFLSTSAERASTRDRLSPRRAAK